MIVKGEHVTDPDSAVRTQDVADIELGTSNPPPYAARNDASAPGSSTSPTTGQLQTGPPLAAKRCNFLSIRRDNQSIKGAYIIDPNIQLPADVLPPLEGGQSETDRPNLALYSENRPVKVDVWVDEVRREVQGNEKRRVIMEVGSDNAAVRIRLKTYNPDQPVKVTVSSRLGGATLVLPSNYVGILNISSKGGWISVSDKVKSRLTIFSEKKGVRNCFVGDVMQEGYGHGEWRGSSAYVDTEHARARVLFAEEAEEFNNSSNFLVRWIYGA